MKEKPGIFEWVAFWLFIALEIVILALRITSPTAILNQAENVLYSAFEIIFSLYIGYFIQRIDSMKQFQDRLKQYGFSAYRRIMDIRKSVDRSINAIDKMKQDSQEVGISDLNILHSMLEGTFDTVESSVLDWSDIIGEEINKKEKADRLEEVLRITETRSNLGEETTVNIKEVRDELEKLKSEIPSVLQTNYLSKKFEEERFQFYSLGFLAQMQVSKCINLSVQNDLGVNLPHAERQKIINGQPYLLKRSFRHNKIAVDVYDKDKQKLGTVINDTYGRLETDGDIYLRALFNLFDFDHLEGKREDGFISPDKCEFGEFYDGDSKFRILISSEVFPTG